MIRLPWPMARLRDDRRGAAATEFAIVAPVLCLLIVGTFDIGHSLYMRSVLQGIVQKTARDAGLEAGLGNDKVIDAKVERQVLALANNADVKFSRRFYRTFSDAAAARAEPFTDTNGNGKCDAGEPYEDQNNNNVHDADGADDGQGGAKDSVLYTVSVNYPRMFPLANFIGISDRTKIEAAMILANQPYGDQGNYGAVKVKYCV